MTTNLEGGPPNGSETPANVTRLNENIARIEELTQRLVQAMAQKRTPNPGVEGPDPNLFAKAGMAYWQEALNNPGKIIEQQAAYWGKSLKHFIDVQSAMAQGKLEPPKDPTPQDRRFANPLWSTHPYFNFIKQQYLFTVEALETAVNDLENVDPTERQRIEFFLRQIVDMMAPTNFLATNPDALERAVETEGESLVKGLENLVRDIEANHGDLLITLADRDAFSVGGNIGTTEGAVVFRNRMLELIQYAPTTEQVHARPLLIFPPWINKFYILDLKPANSLIKWAVDQGYTVFVVSWKNPNASYADVGMSDYVEEGYIAAINEVKRITDQSSVNAVGYCIAGTTLALTLALLNKRRDKSINSATFFTTLTDFSDPGEVGVFLANDFVDGIETEVAKQGYLDKYYMARTFSFLRANDLVYAPAIRSYMLGESPAAFDLLYWNGDGTNLPATMAMEYLRGLCQSNRFAEGAFEICGETLSLSEVKVPLCAIACETDHIAPWKASFDGIRRMGSKDKTFILAQSGHIAGIISPPTKEKYGHYVGDAPEADSSPDEWRAAAEFHKGSWWPRWSEWLAPRSGKKVPARIPGDSTNPVLAPAPGTYVTETPED